MPRGDAPLHFTNEPSGQAHSAFRTAVVTLQRSPWGQKAKARYNAEAQEARAFEDWLTLHRWWWWHVNLPQRSKAGFPDYVMFRERIVWVELKARNPLNNRIGKVSLEQQRFHERIKEAGGEMYVFWLPDDWKLVHDALRHPDVDASVPV